MREDKSPSWARDFAVAMQFLTILPIKGLEATAQDMARSTAAFPLVGLAQGVLAAVLAAILYRLLPPEPGAAIVLVILVITSGGFHLDGLSDTFDAVAKRGSREEKLAVMKDGSSGAIGVTAIFLTLLVKYAALSSLAGSNAKAYYLCLLLMPVLSKWAMLAAMHRGSPARQEGLGRMVMDGARTGGFAKGTAIAIGVLIAGSILTGQGIALALAAMATLYGFVIWSVWFYKGQFGGLSGDTLGATAELADMIFLLVGVAWSRLYIW